MCTGTRQGVPYATVYRYKLEDGRKDFRTYAVIDGREHTGAKLRRLPYRVDKLRDDGPVVIVEGEGCADALAKHVPAASVLSWMGGASKPAPHRLDVSVWPERDRMAGQ